MFFITKNIAYLQYHKFKPHGITTTNGSTTATNVYKIMKAILTLVLLIIISNCYPQKTPLSFTDYEKWYTITNRQLSGNGQYVSYEHKQQNRNVNLIIYNALNSKNDTVKFGYDAIFSANSDFIVFKYKPNVDTVRKAKIDKVKKELMPIDSVGVYVLNDTVKYSFAKLVSYKVPEQNGNFTAILVKHEKPKAFADSLPADTLHNDTTIINKTKQHKAKNKTAKITNNKQPNNLIVLLPTTGKKTIFNNVDEYQVATKGHTVALLASAGDTTKNNYVIYYNTKTNTTDTIFNDTCTIKKITISNDGLKLAFLTSADTTENKTFGLYYFEAQKKQKPQLICDTLTPGIPKNYSVSINCNMYFSQNNNLLYFGTAPKPVNLPKDTLPDDEKPKLDIWGWADADIQPMQLVNLDKELKRTYTAVYNTQKKHILQLADTVYPNIILTRLKNQNFALLYTHEPYKRQSGWTAQWYNNYALVNLLTGQKSPIIKATNRVWLSPSGNITVWYNYTDSNYYCINNLTQKTICLTADIKVPLYDEENDSPCEPEAYGLAAWGQNDKFVFIYDRYDIWKVDITAKLKPVNITNNIGRQTKTVYRYTKTDPELDYIRNNDTIVLNGFINKTKQNYYYTTTFGKQQTPKPIVGGNVLISGLQKAKNTDTYIWACQTVNQYPEITYSANKFYSPKTISQANPQQKNYNWATSQIISWQSYSGDTLEGILYKPENFNPDKKYPVIVYFYERSANELHRYYYPYPSHSIINKTFYASNGYIVFVPDIVYTVGHPAKSAYNAIVSGTKHLIATCPFVDSLKIGLQGQSWGGYQIAHLITQTNMFAAAMAGAPVSNMTSAYGGIRWGSGMGRMFQYEKTQSRIGTTIWDSLELYIENSPLFFANKVNTPLLIMANDNDGAVPWYQGIEYYMALRRLNKPVWLLNYNGMEHNIETKYWANRVDLSKRMFQFFNHYLKNEPAPQWLLKGVKAVDKGKTLGY